LANLQPQRIKDAISYDANTGNFTVTMYRDNAGKAEPVKVEVTQAELLDNVSTRRGGGSTVDNGAGDTPMWPAVMETAYAKMHDSKPADGLDEGYRKIDWGQPTNAFYALTGNKGDEIKPAEVSTPQDIDRVYNQLSTALAANRPVSIGSGAEKPGAGDDGLLDWHVYNLEKISKDKNGDVVLTLRNPLGDNNDGEAPDSNSPTIDIKLSELSSRGSFYGFIGPEPQTQIQQTGGSTPKIEPSEKTPVPGDQKNAPNNQVPNAPQQPDQTSAPKMQGGSGDPYVDSLLKNLSDGASLRDSLKDLAASPDGIQFRQEGKAQFELAQAQAREAQPVAHAQNEHTMAERPAVEQPVAARAM
jgi:hypothetical protein